MNHFSALIGFDTKLLKLQQHCSHYIIKAIAITSADL